MERAASGNKTSATRTTTAGFGVSEADEDQRRLLADRFITALAPHIDHTNLNPNASDAEIEELVGEAEKLFLRSVCVYPDRAALVRKSLHVRALAPIICVVNNFPAGSLSVEEAMEEARLAALDGAREFDTVIDSERVEAIFEELDRARSQRMQDDFVKDLHARVQGILTLQDKVGERLSVKVIVESSRNDLRKNSVGFCPLEFLTEAVRLSGAQYIKTSTGFDQSGGAREEHVRFMHQALGDRVPVKASGGVHTLSNVLSLREAGASVFGMSRTISILEEASLAEISELQRGLDLFGS